MPPRLPTGTSASVCGKYGADHAPYHGLSAVRQQVDMHAVQSARSPDERLLPDLVALLQNPRVQACWDSITTIDPLGLFAIRPTHAGEMQSLSGSCAATCPATGSGLLHPLSSVIQNYNQISLQPQAGRLTSPLFSLRRQFSHTRMHDDPRADDTGKGRHNCQRRLLYQH